MKNGLKIGVVALAMLSTVATLAFTGKVQAEQDSSKKVEVRIDAYNGGLNTCQLENYIFEFTGSTEDQTDTVSHEITCQFGDASLKTVTLQLQDNLSNGSTTIAKEHIKLSNVAWTDNPNDIHGSDSYVFSNQDFYASGGKSLFTKIVNKIGDATGSAVDITVTVPAGTPNGIYTGTLVLDF